MPHHSAHALQQQQQQQQQKRQQQILTTSFAGGSAAPIPPPPPSPSSAAALHQQRTAELEYRGLMPSPHGGPGGAVLAGLAPPHHPHHPHPHSYGHPQMHPHSSHFHPHPSMRPHPPPPVTMAPSWTTTATASPAGSGNGSVVHRVDLHADEHHRVALRRDEEDVARPPSGSSSRASTSSQPDEASGTPRLLPSYDDDHHHNPGGDDEDDDDRIETTAATASRSFDSPHEVAASVLLLAATAMQERDSAKAALRENGTLPEDGPVPKKRKKQRQQQQQQQAAGIMRKKSHDTVASHISPYSHGSTDGHHGGKNAHHSPRDDDMPGTGASGSTEATTPSTEGGGRGGGGTTPGGSASPTSSYDLKDGQALLDSAKITDTRRIVAPPAHVEIPHFPSVLHAVLTESEFAGTVLLWLPHGQAWKIVRWDALRRKVLPKYFAQLREDESKDSSGSIDAFLWHLAAWGFEEVTDGPDAGAYSHILFRRELPGLCREMRFAPTDGDALDTGLAHDKDRSADGGCGARYILQVPSLASTGMASDHSNRSSAPDEEKKEDYSSYPNQVTPVWPKRSHVSLLGYPSDPHGGALAMGAWKYYPETSPQWIGGNTVGGATTSSPTSSGSHRSMPPYSPIRVRSGRGACRLPLNRSRSAQDAPSSSSNASQEPTPTSRSTFPVSNRGKGGKAAAPRRLSLPMATTTTAETGASNSAAPHPSSWTSSSHPPPPRPILKRKLPLMRKSSASDDGSSSHSSAAPRDAGEDVQGPRQSPSERLGPSVVAVVDADEPAEHHRERDNDSPVVPAPAEVAAV